MDTPDRHDSNEQIPLTGILSEFRQALEEEIDRIKKSGQSSTLLYAGRQIESCGTEFWYRFRAEYVPAIPADTPCKLTIGRDQFNVTVISFEENSLVISCKTPLPCAIGRARLENGAAVLLERLIRCIEENAGKENAAGDRMLLPEGGVYECRKVFSYDDQSLYEENTPSQNRAISSALTNDITFIWGPPGTGKTTVIGQLVDELYRRGRSVLVVSHSNAAVDGAIEKADKAYIGAHKDCGSGYPILRLGTPVRALPERVLMKSPMAELGKALYEEKSRLENRQAELWQRSSEIDSLLAKSTWIRESRMAEIQENTRNIEAFDRLIKVIEDEIISINVSVLQEKAAHPEYKDYLLLTKAYAAKENEPAAVCEGLSKNA